MRKNQIKSLVIFGALLSIILILLISTRTTCCSEKLSKDDLSKLTNQAVHGDALAMQRLRFIYEESGEPDKAQFWLEQGAKHGDPLSEAHLAEELLRSKIDADKKLGIQYLMSAAKHGELLAQELLGKRYKDGNLVEKNIELAEFWLKKSAEADSPSGIVSFVDLMASRARTKEDYSECLLWNAKGLASQQIKQGGATYLDLIYQRERILKEAKTASFNFP
jgi:hypothetical protein